MTHNITHKNCSGKTLTTISMNNVMKIENDKPQIIKEKSGQSFIFNSSSETFICSQDR